MLARINNKTSEKVVASIGKMGSGFPLSHSFVF